MSKQAFTETLKFGKCRCGAAGTSGDLCPTTGEKKCPCCDNCRQACQSFLEEMHAALQAATQEEIDREIIENMERLEEQENTWK